MTASDELNLQPWVSACDGAVDAVQRIGGTRRRREEMLERSETILATARQVTGVACERCRGAGSYWYPSTATWHGGMGGASMTKGICDVCWGTGRSDKIGVDLRAQRDEIRRLHAVASARWFLVRTGANIERVREHFPAIVRKLHRARWANFWEGDVARIVASTLEEMVEALPAESDEEWRQCECGAYRRAVVGGGWAAGCRACDKIARLRQLLAEGVRVRAVQARELEPETLEAVVEQQTAVKRG